MTLARFLSVAIVATCTSLAPAFAQEGPKGGGGAGGGGGNGGGGGSVSGVSGGGNSAGAPTGGGGGGSFGGGGGGGGSISSGSSGGGSNFDWSAPRGSRSAGSSERRGEMRAAEPSYARAVPPGSRGSATAGSRPRGDSAAIGQAVMRETPLDRSNIERTPPTRLDVTLGTGFYSRYSSVYYQCSMWATYRCDPYYNPWYSGYGYYGLNSMFYDPSWFQGAGPVTTNPSAGLGTLRLKIKPSKGQVFIDGNYVGTVDEFDGAFQKLKLDQGTHRVEVRLLGYEPLVFEVDIRRGQQTLFEGQLRPRQ